MTPEQIQLAFHDWWKDSFPLIAPNHLTVDTHVAFAVHIQAMTALLAEYDANKQSA